MATCAGFVYFALVIDVFARRIVGWRTSRSARAGALDASEQALHTPRLVAGSGLIHYSERGGQYVASAYTGHLVEAGIEPSVGSDGGSCDNALAETINGLHKAALIHRHGPWRTLQAVEHAGWAGSIGSIITASSAPSGTFRPPRSRRTTMQPERPSTWSNDSNETASAKPWTLHNTLPLDAESAVRPLNLITA